MLVLLDIDGTLLHGDAAGPTSRRSCARWRDVHGVAASAADVAAVLPAGRTDQEIARLVLRGHGVGDAGHHARDAARGWTGRPRSTPRSTPAIPGRPSPPGRPRPWRAWRRPARRWGCSPATSSRSPGRRWRAPGLGGWFPAGDGAFGSDHERRAALVPIARARAAANGGAPARVAVVGDTPRDIACARAGGARCVAVATGAHGAAELAAADAVAADLAGAAAALEGWLRP